MSRKLKLTAQETYLALRKEKSIRNAKRSRLLGILFIASPSLLFLFGLHNKLETGYIIFLTILLVIIGLGLIWAHIVYTKKTKFLTSLIN